jgi:hypothetical protein
MRFSREFLSKKFNPFPTDNKNNVSVDRIRNVFSGKFTVHDGLMLGHVLFAFSIPFSQKINNIGLMALMSACVVALIGRKPGRPGLFFILSALLVGALSLIAIQSVAPLREAMSDLHKFIPVALFPLLMFLSESYYKENRIRDAALWSFSIAVTLTCFHCLLIGFYNFIVLEPSLDAANEDHFNRILSSWNYLSYERLSDPSGLHPAYLSLFISFSVFFLLSERGRLSIKIPMIVLLIIFMGLLASRTGLLAFAITFIAYLFLNRKQIVRSLRTYMVLGVAAVVLLGTLFYADDVFRKRITDFTTIDTDVNVESWNALNLRLAIWKCNVAIGTDNVFTGIGFNDDIRNACYEQYSFYPHYGTGFNAHNQFLEFFVVGGVGLLILLILYLVIPWHRAVVNFDSLLVLLLILICVNLMTECMLSRIKGVMFVCYFISLCYYSSPLERSKTENSLVR